MVDNFESYPGGIRVREQDGRFRPVKTPEGFTDYAFRSAVAAFDTCFRTLGKIPSVTEVHQYWPRIPVKTYSALFLTPQFKEALSYRGIEWADDTGLSIEQSMLLLMLTDPTDRRTTKAKCKDLNIPYSRYQAWMQHPLFKQSYFQRSEAMFKDSVPMVLNRLVGNAEAGDDRAIGRILEMTGRWNPQAQQVQDARQVVMTVIQSVILNVKDPAVRQAILNDVEVGVVSYDVLNQQSLEG